MDIRGWVYMCLLDMLPPSQVRQKLARAKKYFDDSWKYKGIKRKTFRLPSGIALCTSFLTRQGKAATATRSRRSAAVSTGMAFRA